MDFKDKVILVTGATSGIGQGIAKKLLELGAKVIVNYAHNEEKANETKDIFEKYTDNALFIKADVSNENDVKNMFEMIDNKYGRLDGLVNNAAYDKINSIENLTPLAKQSYTEEEIELTAKKNPNKRLGKIEDTVNAVLFLLSEQADYINGEN